MRTATRSNARRAPRGPACDDRPRLWGDEPAPPAAEASAARAAEIAVVPAPVAEPAVVPAAAPIAEAIASPDETYAVASSATLVAPPAQTLEDLIAGTWDGLVAGEEAACPVCAASMTPRWSAGAGVVGGRCGGCGTTLE